MALRHISSRHSNLNFAHHIVIYWLFQNGANKNQHQDSYQRETVPDKFVFFTKLVRQKKSIGWAKYVYVWVWDMYWRSFCNFPWWLENVKSTSKIVLSSNEHHFEIWFPKKRTIMFSWSKLSKLHKKDPILHNYIFPKTRGNKNKPWTHSTPLKRFLTYSVIHDKSNKAKTPSHVS